MLATLALHVSKLYVCHPLFDITLSLTWDYSRTVHKGYTATCNQKIVLPLTSSVRREYPVVLLCLFCSGRTFLFIFDAYNGFMIRLRYGGAAIEGSALLYNGSAIVAQSVARARFHFFSIRSRVQTRKILGNSGYLRQLQLSPWASWVPARRGR